MFWSWKWGLFSCRAVEAALHYLWTLHRARNRYCYGARCGVHGSLIDEGTSMAMPWGKPPKCRRTTKRWNLVATVMLLSNNQDERVKTIIKLINESHGATCFQLDSHTLRFWFMHLGLQVIFLTIFLHHNCEHCHHHRCWVSPS